MLQLCSICEVADNTGAKRAAIIGVLEKAYGKRDLEEAMEAEQEFENCRRDGEHLQSFLARYAAVRARALRTGMTCSGLTDGMKLLRSAELGHEATCSVLQQVSTQARTQASIHAGTPAGAHARTHAPTHPHTHPPKPPPTPTHPPREPI